MPTGQEVANGTTVAGYQALEAPFFAQYLLFVAGLTATWLTVDALIGTHHLGHLALLHQSLEGWQIGLPEVALGQVLHIEGMAVPFWSAMHGKVLGTGQQLLIVAQRLTIVAVALQATHHSKTHLRRQEGVFAIGLLSSTPTRVAEDIDIGCPERQTLIAADVS